jgi:phosphohistidine phosphatase
MRRLILLRHVKSAWSEFGKRDHERTLAARGREAAPRIGAYMASHALEPDLVVCSTAARARETYDLVGPAFASAPPVVYDERLYDAGPDRILAVIKDTGDGVHSLLVVGHNPGLKDFAEMMVAAGDTTMRRKLAEKLPTGGMVVIDFPVDSWSALNAHSGRLDRFVVPRTLDADPD